ncbi:MAG: aldehyde dehydrogenase family protein, partial [Longimicrobiales bacterium]
MSTDRRVTSLLDGAAVDGSPGGELRVANPARLDDRVATASLGGAETFVEACRRAKAAQQAWADVPAPVRGRAIQHLGRLVEDNLQALAALITREIGKPIEESRGEVQEVVDTCTFFLGEGRRLYGHTVPSEMPDKQLFTFRRPVGTAAIVTAGNFPVAVPSWYLVPALLCGNTVVWKPAEYAPTTAEAFAQLILHAGFPVGTFQLVLADGPRTFEGLERALDSGVVDKVGFTGSSDVGRRIGELCGRHLQSPCLELGGKNPLVVMPDADLDLAVEGALFSGFGTAGQRCTALGTVIVHRDVHDDFLDRFSKALTDAPIGDPTAGVLYGPMISARFCERYEGWLELI